MVLPTIKHREDPQKPRRVIYSKVENRPPFCGAAAAFGDLGTQRSRMRSLSSAASISSRRVSARPAAMSSSPPKSLAVSNKTLKITFRSWSVCVARSTRYAMRRAAPCDHRAGPHLALFGFHESTATAFGNQVLQRSDFGRIYVCLHAHQLQPLLVHRSGSNIALAQPVCRQRPLAVRSMRPRLSCSFLCLQIEMQDMLASAQDKPPPHKGRADSVELLRHFKGNGRPGPGGVSRRRAGLSCRTNGPADPRGCCPTTIAVGHIVHRRTGSIPAQGDR